MGYAVDVGDVLIEQTKASLMIEQRLAGESPGLNWQRSGSKSPCDPSIPAQSAVANATAAAVPQTTAVLSAMATYFPGLEQGVYPPGVLPSTQLCFGGCASAAFWVGWFNKTEPAAKEAALKAAVVEHKLPVWAVNSPTDINLPPYAYTPLAKIIAGIAGAAGGATAEHVVLENLTHEMTPADLSSPAVSLQLLAKLSAWLNGVNAAFS
jgi:hypothetical protein